MSEERYVPTMAGVFELGLIYHPDIRAALAHMFLTLGNGIDLDNRGYIRQTRYVEGDFVYPDPEPLRHLYPPSSLDKQVYEKFAGCATKGFSEAVEYFIDCLTLTPDTVEHAVEWKAKIPHMEEVLLDTPVIQPKFKDENDMESLQAILNSDEGKPRWSDNTPSMSQVWVLETTWTDCPKFVIEEVRHLWSDQGYGNDYYYHSFTMEGEMFDQYPCIYMWAKHNGLKDGDKFLVHYWW